jgi:hypothetical protein
MLLIVSAAVPALMIVTVCGMLVVPGDWFGNTTFVVEKLMPGPIPVPVSGTSWGVFWALSVNVSVAVRAAPAVGVNLTLSVQLAPCGTNPKQSSAS